MHVDWTALGKTALLSAVIGVAVVCAFTLGVLGLARVDDARDTGGAAARIVGYAQAALAFGACAAGVGYGLYLLIPQLH